MNDLFICLIICILQGYFIITPTFDFFAKNPILIKIKSLNNLVFCGAL